MRVVITSPVWSLNGVNVFSENLARGLRSAGVDARILLTGITYRERKPLALPQDVIVEQLVIPRWATWSVRRRSLRKYLEGCAPCVYLPNHDFNHSSISESLPDEVGVVGILHSDDAQHYEHFRRMGGSWNAVVAVSRAIADRIESEHLVEPSRISTIPYGVRVATELPVRNAEGTVRLVYAGRLDADQKRVGDLVELANALKRRSVPFEMAIVGEGRERDALNRAIANSNLSASVRVHSTATSDELTTIYANADAFVLMSAYEGMPIGLLEAMGQGCVPFATRIASGIPDLITHGANGFSAPVGDIEGFAALIEDFASSPSERTRLSGEAWRTIADGPYTLDKMLAGYMAVFERVTAEIQSRQFVRASANGTVPVSIRDRIAAPLWALRPAMRAQQRLAR